MKKKNRLLALSLLIVAIGTVAYAIIKNPFAQTGEWQIAKSISNVGTQQTTEFTIDNQWRIVWSIQNRSANLFVVAVYMNSSSGYSSIAEADATDTNATVGVLPVDYTGSFVIRVITLSDTEWTLLIEEFVKKT